MWNKVTELAKKKDFDQAYKSVLTEGDDLYLLRLMSQSGPVARFLDQDTACEVLSRLDELNKAGVFESFEIDWLEDSKRAGVFANLSANKQKEYMGTLWHLARSEHLAVEVRERATEVYQSVKKPD